MERPAEFRSRLYALMPIIRRLPEVERPKRHITFKEKFMWSALALVAFFIMGQITLYGIERPAESLFGNLRFVLASKAGSLMELGIGPIVTAGIIMQLLVGSRLIALDLSKPEDRALFTGAQKLLVLVVGAIQALAVAFMTGYYGVGLTVTQKLFVAAQLTLGVIIVLYLDELVSKYGFGSGISLFIAGGVSMALFTGAFNPFPPRQGGVIPGAIPNLIINLIAGRGLEEAFLRPPPLPDMMGVIGALVIFLIVVYAEGMRIEVPLAYGRFGIRGRYPIKFLYTSVIPVILAMIVFTNVRIFSSIFPPLQAAVPFITPPQGVLQVMDNPLRASAYIAILAPLCMGFAWLWVNLTEMGPKDVAKQLDRAGMLIPGFRRDVGIMEKVFSRHITVATLLGGAFVGILAALADFLGALGTGTGILLTVGILYRLYEQMARERVTEMFPALRRLFGE